MKLHNFHRFENSSYIAAGVEIHWLFEAGKRERVRRD